MRDRHTGVTARRQSGRDPGHDLELDSMTREHIHLVGRMGKHGRIAPLEPHDNLVGTSQLHQLRVNLGLRPHARSAVTPQTDPLGRRRSMLQNSRIHQIVVQHDIRPLETLHPA